MELKLAQKETENERLRVDMLTVQLQQINPLATAREMQMLKDEKTILRHQMEDMKSAMETPTKEKALST